jgi:hypothetical protein
MEDKILIWTDPPKSGLCDRLIDFSLMAAYARLNNSKFSSKWVALSTNYNDKAYYHASESNNDGENLILDNSGIHCKLFKEVRYNDYKSENFLKYFTFYIELERRYSFFQMVKTLDFMGLQYKNLHANDLNSKVLRDTMYKEKTNVLSYYVIKTILLYHYPLFLQWCSTNNLSLLQFKKTYYDVYNKFVKDKMDELNKIKI